MPLVRRALACLLAGGLSASALTALAAPALADAAVSGVAIDSLSQDGLLLSSGSFHTPTYVVTPTSTSGNGFRLVTTSASSGGAVGTAVTLTPPTGSTFTAGAYPLARFADATHASLATTFSSCSSEGTLTVDSITTDPADGHLTSLAASFAWRCTGATSYAYGILRYLTTDYVAGSQVTAGGGSFGSVAVGQAGAARTVTISATGTLPLTLGTATVAGANPGDFTISNDTCSGATLQPAVSCTLSLAAAPTARGARTAQLQVPDNTARGLRAVNVQVTGYVAPGAPTGLHAETATDGVWLTWNPPSDDGGSAVTSYQVLRGTSEADLSVVGTSPGYSFGDVLSGTTAAGTTYVYAVKAVNGAGAGAPSGSSSGTTPASVVTPSATKVLAEDVETATAPHTQNGRAVVDGAGGASLSVSVNYPGVQINGFPSGALYAQGLYVTPPTGQFVAAGTFPLAAAADASHAGVLLSTPEQVGCTFSSGTLTVTAFERSTSGAAAIVDLDVSGTCSNGNTAAASARIGVDRTWSAAAATGGDGASVPVGQSHDVVAGYANTGTVPIHLGQVALTAPGGGAASGWTLGSTDTCSNSTVAAGASCSTTFTATPTTGGSSTAEAVFSDDTPVGTRTRDLTVTGLVAPAAPSSLAQSRSGGKVTLSWYDPGDSSQRATSFQVLRGTSDADATLIASVPAAGLTSTSWTDPDTSDGTRYYAVRAVNAAGTSTASTITLDLALRAPGDLYGTSTSRAGYLSWTAPTGEPKDPITGYAVYRGATSTSLVKVATVPGTSTSVAAIPGGTHAFFKVAAVTASGAGPLSSVLDVVGPTSQLVIAGADDSLTTSVSVHPLTAAPLSSTVVQDGQLHDEVAVSPNGTLVAYTTGTSTRSIFVRRVDGTGTPVAIATGSADQADPAWSPDGKTIAFTKNLGSTDTICKVPATGGAQVCAAQTGVATPSWLTSTTLVVTDETSATSPLATITFTGSTRTPLPGTEGGFLPSVSPDGKRVAYVVSLTDTADALRVYTLASKATVSLPSPVSEYLGTPSWAHDGLSVYYTGNNDSYSSVYHSQADGSGVLSSVTGNHGFAFGVSVSTPDTTAPTAVRLAGVPTSTLGASVTPTFSATDALNGVATYTLLYRKAAYNGAFGAAASLTLTAPRAIALSKGYEYCFSVKATDRVGNTSAATPEQCTVVPMDDRSLTRSSAFAPVTGSAYYASTAMRATAKGATLTRTGITSARQLYLVVTTCATCGTLDVLVGSARVASVNLHSASTANRKVIALPAFSARSGTVTLRVTSSGKPVIVDGLGVRK